MITITGEVFMTGEASYHIQAEGKVARRRNKRVRMRFPVSLEVPSAEGGTRTIAAHTVVVSHAGATLDVGEDIPVGIGLQVSPPFGGSLLAEVNGDLGRPGYRAASSQHPFNRPARVDIAGETLGARRCRSEERRVGKECRSWWCVLHQR